MSLEGYWIVCRAHENDNGCQASSKHFPGLVVDGLSKEAVMEECENKIRAHLIALQEHGHEFPPFESHAEPPKVEDNVIEMKFLIVEDFGHKARDRKSFDY